MNKKLRRGEILCYLHHSRTHTAVLKQIIFCLQETRRFRRRDGFAEVCKDYCVKSLKNILDFCLVASMQDVVHAHKITVSF